MGRTLPTGGVAGWVAGCLMLAACANPQNEAALAAPRTLVGLPKADLLACAGVPERTARAGGAELLAYSRRQTIVEREVDWERDNLLWRHGVRAYRPEVEVWSRTFGCEATFVIRDGRVAELRYDAHRDPELCYRIVGACLPPVR
ncbi:hypothetical protein [Azospirillum sp. ST 5-10]|uniref:hypothetical protein n=1 Tax=unclassified Azospirillum TaxID=2630922 RepID=UPI003F4A8086